MSCGQAQARKRDRSTRYFCPVVRHRPSNVMQTGLTSKTCSAPTLDAAAHDMLISPSNRPWAGACARQRPQHTQRRDTPRLARAV